MDAIDYTSTTGTLVIDGVPMHTPAWHVPDLRRLWVGPNLRGSDVIVDGFPGVVATLHMGTSTTYPLPFVITGACDVNGVLVCEDTLEAQREAEMAQYQENLDFLRLYVLDPTNVTDGCRPASLTMPGGDVRTARVRCLPLALGDDSGAQARGVLTLEIPLGGFV